RLRTAPRRLLGVGALAPLLPGSGLPRCPCRVGIPLPTPLRRLATSRTTLRRLAPTGRPGCTDGRTIRPVRQRRTGSTRTFHAAWCAARTGTAYGRTRSTPGREVAPGRPPGASRRSSGRPTRPVRLPTLDRLGSDRQTEPAYRRRPRRPGPCEIGRASCRE